MAAATGTRAAAEREGLFVRTAGGGPPMALLHGLASSSRYWEPAVPYLAPRHRLLLPDLLGFGRSPKPFDSAYTLDDHVAWLHRALPPLAGQPFDLVGHSLGSIVALGYTLRHPEQVRSLVLISLPVIGCLPWGHRPDGSPRRLHRLVAHTRTGARLAGLAIRAAWPLGWVLAPRLQRDVPPAAARAALQVTAASYWRTLEAVVYGSDVPALVDRLTRPLLLVHGAQDRTAPLAPVLELAGAHPRVSLRIVQDAGHNPIVARPAEVVALIEEFSATLILAAR